MTDGFNYYISGIKFFLEISSSLLLYKIIILLKIALQGLLFILGFISPLILLFFVVAIVSVFIIKD